MFILKTLLVQNIYFNDNPFCWNWWKISLWWSELPETERKCLLKEYLCRMNEWAWSLVFFAHTREKSVHHANTRLLEEPPSNNEYHLVNFDSCHLSKQCYAIVTNSCDGTCKSAAFLWFNSDKSMTRDLTLQARNGFTFFKNMFHRTMIKVLS